jgi:DNA-binding MarR family transcriptional regulator
VKDNQKVDMEVLSTKLGYHLRVAERHIHAGRKFSKATGFTTIQYSVFALIATNQGTSQVAVGKALGMDKPSIMTILNRLEQDGLIKRSISLDDKRTNALLLTAHGKKIYASLEKKVTRYDDLYKKKISNEKLEQLMVILSELNRV